MSPTYSGPSTRYTSRSASRSSSRHSHPIESSGASPLTSMRTACPRSRRLSSACSEMSRSSASSSSISMSKLRVTRNEYCPTICICGKIISLLRKMRSSSATKARRAPSSGTRISRGRVVGTWTTPNDGSAVCSRLSKMTPTLMLLLRTCGNGCTGSMAIGVSTGKMS